MTHSTRSSRALRSTLLLALLGLATPAAAQLDLPDRPVADERSRARDGAELPRRSGQPKRSLRESVTGGGSDEGLSLPDRAGRARPNGATEQALEPGPSTSQPAVVDVLSENVLAELQRVESLDDRLIAAAVRTLGSLGDSGLVAARLALYAEHPPTVLAALLTLIGSSDPNDWPLVRARLDQPFPAGSAAEIVERVLAADPVRASPQLLAHLLDHPQGAVRAVVQRRLTPLVEPAVLPYLAEPLSSKRTDTRLRALELVIDIDHPQRIDVLFEKLIDPQARVASLALQTLAGLDSPGLVDRLMKAAFESRWILREHAYALLVLVEREDLFFEPLLDASHAEPLFGGLASNDVFVAGASAAALAGIGFRSSVEAGSWLDRDVPARLVRTVAGLDFHSDFSSLRPIAERRLALIAGETFGSDGPAWVDWWARVSGDFRSRRAVLAARPEDSGRLVLRYRDDAGEFQLIGPDRALVADDHPLDPAWGEVLVLSSQQALDLFEVCSKEGLFGTDRLPGKRGVTIGAGRALEVGIGMQAKSFRFGGARTEPWFERVVEAATALRDLNRWQRYPNPALYASSIELWRVESSWWNDPRPQVEKDRRMVEMILNWLPARAPAERSRALRELARLYAREGVASFDDLPALLRFVRGEKAVGPRLTTLIGLALDALALDPDGSGTELWTDELVETLLVAFGTESAGEIARVLEAAGPAAARARAEDRRPFLRAVAGRVLARSDAPEDRALLGQLLSDTEVEVEAATLRSIGRERVVELRDEVLTRARVGRPGVRADALRTVGRLGGDGALDALRIGLSEDDPELRVAAAEGLEALEDPRTTPILVQLLGTPRTGELYAAGWRGLRALGSRAWPELLRVVDSPGHRARREVALLLAREGVPDAVPTLLRLLTDDPNDAVVAEELAVLSCVDLRSRPNPSEAWWSWWDEVVHDDAHAWFAAALLRAGIEVPKPQEFEGRGSRAAALACLAALDGDGEALAERARRELARMLDVDLGPRPEADVDRDAWLYTLREAVLERRE